MNDRTRNALLLFPALLGACDRAAPPSTSPASPPASTRTDAAAPSSTAWVGLTALDAGTNLGLGFGGMGALGIVHPAEPPAASLARVRALPEVARLLAAGYARLTLRPDDADMTSCTGAWWECERWVRVDRRAGASGPWRPWHVFAVDPVSGTVTVGSAGPGANGAPPAMPESLEAWRSRDSGRAQARDLRSGRAIQ